MNPAAGCRSTAAERGERKPVPYCWQRGIAASQQNGSGVRMGGGASLPKPKPVAAGRAALTFPCLFSAGPERALGTRPAKPDLFTNTHTRPP
jgi:hypothetical protein